MKHLLGLIAALALALPSAAGAHNVKKTRDYISSESFYVHYSYKTKVHHAQHAKDRKKAEAHLLKDMQKAFKNYWFVRVRIHNQNMTTAANAQADRKTFGHRS